MKKAIFFSFGFLLLHIVCLYVHERVMEKSHLMRSGNEMETMPKDPDIIILGGSHSFSIQTHHLPNSVSFSNPSEVPHNTYFKLRYIIEELKTHPKTIILPLDLGNLKQTEIDKQPHQFYWNKYEYPTELYPFSKNKNTFVYNRIINYIFPYLDAETDIFDYLNKKDKAPQVKLRQERTFQNLCTKTIPIENDSCLQAQFSNLETHFLEKTVALCQAHDIRIVFIRYPVTANYYGSESSCFSPDEYYSLLGKRLQFYERIRILDYHDRYEKIHFRDPHHLKNDSIRVIFTKKVLTDLMKVN